MFSLTEEHFFKLTGVSKELTLKYEKEYESYLEITNKGRPHDLPPRDEVVIFLLHLRQYPVDLFLGTIFGVSKQTLRNIRNRMLRFFTLVTSPHISCGTPSWRYTESFLLYYEHVTFIIDGSEQPVYTSRKRHIDNRFFSTKKGQPSINILVAISPKTKRIIYLSPSYPGSNNDNVIFDDDIKKNFLNQLQHWEHGIGDSGFNGLEDFNMISSPSKKDKKISKMFSQNRIEIECKLEEIKDFRACKDRLRLPPSNVQTILDTHQANWRIASAFINMRLTE